MLYSALRSVEVFIVRVGSGKFGRAQSPTVTQYGIARRHASTNDNVDHADTLTFLQCCLAGILNIIAGAAQIAAAMKRVAH